MKRFTFDFRTKNVSAGHLQKVKKMRFWTLFYRYAQISKAKTKKILWSGGPTIAPRPPDGCLWELV